MSEKMLPIPYDQLLDQISREYETNGTIFGVGHIWKAGDKTLPIFGGKIESPVGPASGPNTQLAQNIVASYAAGARFFELKTVHAPVERIGSSFPELDLTQAMHEYIKAWKLLKVISQRYDLGSPDGFVFQMSAGYTLEGIQSKEMTAFLEGMTQAGASHSILFNARPGCQADEIEMVANYLMADRGLDTFIKFSPTLLGYDFCRSALDKLGCDEIALDEQLFKDSLPWEDAIDMFQRLHSLGKHMNIEFGLKFADSLPTSDPAQEVAGRTLFPIVTELVRKTAEATGGDIRISYSGGADFTNAGPLFEAGVWPITMASNLLSAGGYNRLCQMADMLSKKTYVPFTSINVSGITAIAKDAIQSGAYKMPLKPIPSRKIPEQVPLLDCFFAPCREGCPIGQDIPAYLHLCGQEKYLDALKVITQRNPLPNITGTICSHKCMLKCTRQYYEGPVDIRGCKLEAALAAYDALLASIEPPAPNGKSVAVVGAGPAGISTAYLLAREGYKVTVFEKEENAGGVVRRVIPSFRISEQTVEKDVALAKAYGAEFRFGQEITSMDMLSGYDEIVICTGAWIPGQLKLTEGEAKNVIQFLATVKKRARRSIVGKHVIIVGGGNTAMDAARAAKRLPGVKSVTVVYRRDVRNMPADEAELNEALAEGVIFRDLRSPISLSGKSLKCEIMALGEPDAAGRRSPVGTGEYEQIPADTVIAAVGERTDSALYAALGIELDEKGRAIIDPNTGRTNLPHVYLAGDGAKGPSTVVEAIAGATRVVRAICHPDLDKYAPLNVAPSPDGAMAKKGVYCQDCREGNKCLECATVCENCVDVCPNRANVPILVSGKIQILHLEGPCSHCDNCRIYCPWNSAPYEEKWTLFPDEESFAGSTNQGFVCLGGARIRARFAGEEFEADMGESSGKLPMELAVFTRTVLFRYPDLIVK